MGFTESGLTAGKRDIEYQGHNRVVITSGVIGDYETDGVSFDPSLETGHSRESVVIVHVEDDSGYVARYDYDERSIRLFGISDGAEPEDAETVNVPVRLRVEGR